jgi:hypothetical protein
MRHVHAGLDECLRDKSRPPSSGYDKLSGIGFEMARMASGKWRRRSNWRSRRRIG